MRSHIVTAMAVMAMLCGCTQSQIARAEQAANVAAQAVEKAEATLAEAQKALVIASAVANATGSTDAQAAVAKAQEAVAQAAVALPALRATAEGAAKVADDARRGAAWWEIGLGVLGAVAGAALPILRARNAAGTATRVAQAAVDFADQLKPLAENDDRYPDVATKARQVQLANGTYDVLKGMRE